jgi:hypothetical protein
MHRPLAKYCRGDKNFIKDENIRLDVYPVEVFEWIIQDETL